MAEQAPMKSDPDYVDYVMKLGSGILQSGVINEPRLFFDEIPLNADPGVIVAGNPDTFYNGEQFPIRLTHMLAAVRYLESDDQRAVANPLDIGRVLLRLQFHNQFYMNPTTLPLPLWGNKAVAAPEPFSFGNAHWDFVESGQPFILAVRDTMIVRVELQDAAAPASGVPVNVAFHGMGTLSRRPYIFTGETILTALGVVDLNTVDFRNDGSEPVLITDLTVTVGGEVDDVDPTGDINRIRISIRQVGHGTQSAWFIGPQAAVPPIQRTQATLLGVTTGRAVVHRFPGYGLLWEPGEGITAEAQSLVADLPVVLCLAFAGYIMVT